MSDLQVCQGCQRHIRVSESACPFCAEPNRNPLTRSPGRSALLAGALVGAATLGCESKPKSKAPPPVETPPVAAVIDAAAAVVAADAAPAAAPPDAGAADAAAPDAAPAKKKRKKKKKVEAVKPPKEPYPPPMPYGAPPARNRLV